MTKCADGIEIINLIFQLHLTLYNLSRVGTKQVPSCVSINSKEKYRIDNLITEWRMEERDRFHVIMSKQKIS